MAAILKVLIPTGLVLTGCVLTLHYQRREQLAHKLAEGLLKTSVGLTEMQTARSNGLDVAWQDPARRGTTLDLGKPYAVGIDYQWRLQRYAYCFAVYAFDPRREPELVKAAAAYYQSDSTYLDVLVRKGGITEALVYRKTAPAKAAGESRPEVFRYMMWRWERVSYSNGHLHRALLREMNQHLF